MLRRRAAHARHARAAAGGSRDRSAGSWSAIRCSSASSRSRTSTCDACSARAVCSSIASSSNVARASERAAPARRSSGPPSLQRHRDHGLDAAARIASTDGGYRTSASLETRARRPASRSRRPRSTGASGQWRSAACRRSATELTDRRRRAARVDVAASNAVVALSARRCAHLLLAVVGRDEGRSRRPAARASAPPTPRPRGGPAAGCARSRGAVTVPISAIRTLGSPSRVGDDQRVREHLARSRLRRTQGQRDLVDRAPQEQGRPVPGLVEQPAAHVEQRAEVALRPPDRDRHVRATRAGCR